LHLQSVLYWTKVTKFVKVTKILSDIAFRLLSDKVGESL